jgi:hypothetical protein
MVPGHSKFLHTLTSKEWRQLHVQEISYHRMHNASHLLRIPTLTQHDNHEDYKNNVY